MTLKNATVLYKHRLELGKRVDDILNIYPELAKVKKDVEHPDLVKARPQHKGK